MLTSQHDPIRHILIWDSFTKEVKIYRSVESIVTYGIRRLPWKPGAGTIRYFDADGAVDLTETIQQHLRDAPDALDHLMSRSKSERSAAQQRLTKCINDQLPEPM